MILHDLACHACNREFNDQPISMSAVDSPVCPECSGPAEILYRARVRRNAQWGDGEVAVVFRDASGKIFYPTRNDQPTPKGRERVEIRSLAEMQRFEKTHKVTNEALHYDRGTGNGFETGDRHNGRPVERPAWDTIDFMGRR